MFRIKYILIFSAKCYLDEDEDLKEKLIQIRKMESRVTYTLMDRINYPTQEYAMVDNDSKHQLLQTCPEIGIFGVFVRLVTTKAIYISTVVNLLFCYS